MRKSALKNTMKKMFAAVMIAIVLFNLSSCGRKSSLLPPEESAPGPVVFPRLEAYASTLVLKWLPPKQTAGGDEIIGTLSYDILRRLVGKDSYQSFEEIAVIEPDPDEKRGQGVPFEYEDADVVQGGQYEYLIVPRDSYGYEGVPAVRLRVTFIGVASVIETLPFEEVDADSDSANK